jgi:cytidyltransferase-like protein
MSDCTDTINKITTVYIDGVFDMFHIGHIRALEKAKNVRSNVHLIVGVVSDADATPYKRAPIYDENSRYELVRSMRIVDRVIFPAPLIVTKGFILANDIDLVVHGFSNTADAEKQAEFFADIADQFELIPYYPFASTTNYIEKIINGLMTEQKQCIDSQSTGTLTIVQEGSNATNPICSYHGGADVHTIENLKEDMSVTTNTHGLVGNYFDTLTSEKFELLATHYPPNEHDYELMEEYMKFVYGPERPPKTPNIVFGNGATELIDRVISLIPGKSWKTNDVMTQYREYSNALSKRGMIQVPHDDMTADIVVVINPSNPTGTFLPWEEMVGFCEKSVPDNATLIVDESMLFWYGESWLDHSMLGHVDWVNALEQERCISVVVIQSWTKFFSSTGLRIGSAVIFSDELHTSYNHMRTPWPMNALGRDYLIHSFNTPSYSHDTWKDTRVWREGMIHRISEIYPKWEFRGADFLSWLWVDVGSSEVADKVVDVSRTAGFPIRHGKHGYNMPTYVRIAVRNPDHIGGLFDALETLVDNEVDGFINMRSLSNRLIVRNDTIPLQAIMCHELAIESRSDALMSYIQETEFGVAIPSIIVHEVVQDESKLYIVIDGHHRLCVLTKFGYTEIPVSVIRYNDPSIVVHPNNDAITKDNVIHAALSREIMEPKSTQHTVMYLEKMIPLVYISNMFFPKKPVY